MTVSQRSNHNTIKWIEVAEFMKEIEEMLKD